MNTIRADVHHELQRSQPSTSETQRHRVVDPLRDEGVWAILDDACNSCCHGSAWRKNAEVKWKAKGFKCILIDARPRNFGGVGRGIIQSKGQYRMPFALQLEETLRRVPGVIDSHEVNDSDQPVLMSQLAQARFGFVKSMRDGTITCKDYDDQSIEVVRQKGIGLFMVRIDHLDLGDYLEFVHESEQARSVIHKTSDAYYD